jgi:dipeptidyl aminopeptidase/acylaminoacyl peptidase
LQFCNQIALILGLRAPEDVTPSGDPSPKLGARDFFKHPDAWTFRLSPDGKSISCLKPLGPERRLNIFVGPPHDQAGRWVTAETKSDILSYFWNGNDYLVYLVDRQRNDDAHLFRVHLRKPGVDAIDLTAKLGVTDVIAQLDDPSNGMLVHANVDDGRFVFRLDLAALAMTKVAEVPEKFGEWLVDRKGILRGVILVHGLDIVLRTRPDGDSAFRTVLASDFRHSIDPGPQIFWDPKTGKEMIYAISNIGRNTKALVKIDPDTGRQEEPPLHVNEKFDVSGMEVSRKSGVTCALFSSWRSERKCLVPAAREIYKAIGRELQITNKVMLVDIIARDRTEEKFVVAVSSDQNPGECYLFEHKPNKTFEVRKLGERTPELKKFLSRTEPIEYLSRDGLIIPGYLTIPREHDTKKRLPLIVIVHGGPWSRITWGYAPRENREVQFFASRGYAVLQMNFRGSTGYGCEFCEAGFKQWGKTMQDDITDGVRWAIGEREIADPKRIAIVGESYGGYAALAAITFAREEDFQYAAAVDRAGISDLLTRMLEHNSPQQHEMIGHSLDEQEQLNAVSPALYADQLTTPLFVAHGIHDTAVLPSQSDRIVAALSSRGVHAEYLRLNEGHLFVNEESKIEYYERVERFLEKYLC